MEALPVTPKLPQPLRQVDKVLTSLVEKAVQLSEAKKGGKSQTGVSYEETGPTVLPSAHSEPLGAVTCVALSSDERHLFAGLASGQLLAVSTTTGSVIASLEVGDGSIDTVAEIILRPNGDSDRGVAAVEEDGGVPGGEAWKVLVVAAGEEVHFFRVSGVLEDNAFIQFATAQLPPGTRTESHVSPGTASLETTSPTQTRGGVKTMGITFEAGLFWASTHNGALVIFPLPAQPPPQEATSDTPPVSQLTPLFILPPGTAAAAAGFARSPSPSASPSASVNTHPEFIIAADEHLRFALRTLSLREKPGDAKPLWFCELYVWWEGRNRILMYEVPWKGPGSVIEKGVVAEPRKGREWTMPYMVTSGALSADGAFMVVGLGDGTLVLIDLHLCLTHRLFQRLDGPVTAIAFTDYSARRPPEAIVAVSSGGEMKVHRLTGEKGEEGTAVPVRKGVTDIAVQEGTSRALLFTDDERHVQLIDCSTGAVLGSFFPGEGFQCSRAQAPCPRPWAYTGRHVLAQIAHQIEERKEEGHVAIAIEGDAESASPQTAGVEHPPSELKEPPACLLFYSLQDAALSRHSDSFAGLFGGPQLLERLLHDSASVKPKAADGSRRPSILQMSPRGKPSRHGFTALPLESPRDAKCPPRHVSISSESPPNRSSMESSPSVGVNKPYPSPRTNPLGVNKPLSLGQQSLTRESSLRRSEAGSAASPRGDLASKASPGGSPRRGGLKPASPKGRIVGLPVAAKEEATVDVGYRDAVPAILDRLSSKGGGRFAREQRMRQRQEEMLQELATNHVDSLRKVA